MAAPEVQTYGVVLVKGATYMYKGVRFRKFVPAEVDRATRDHLVSSGHFRDTDYEEPEPQPRPVRRRGEGARREGSMRVRRRSQPEPGMVSSEGGATASGEAEPTDDGPDAEPAEEAAVEV